VEKKGDNGTGPIDVSSKAALSDNTVYAMTPQFRPSRFPAMCRGFSRFQDVKLTKQTRPKNIFCKKPISVLKYFEPHEITAVFLGACLERPVLQLDCTVMSRRRQRNREAIFIQEQTAY
jgi:hypothetical protein